MTAFLGRRAGHLTEQMDDPGCNREDLFNTYRQFSHVNGLISRWRSLFDGWIAPLARPARPLRILDVGSGGGDICLKFSQWSEQADLSVEITGIDPDPRAAEYTAMLEMPGNVEFRQAHLSELVRNREQYDVVVSNHLIHHLQTGELVRICREAEALDPELAIFNDIRRSGLGFAAFGITAPLLYRSSFIVRDGFTSIRRSFTFPELKRAAPSGWQVRKLFPFRLLLIYERA